MASTRVSVTAILFTISLVLPCFATRSAAQEPSLQSILDGWFKPGCVNVDQEDGAVKFPPGAYTFTLIARFKSFGNQFGWYPLNDPEERHEIFSPSSVVGETAPVTIPVAFGFYLSEACLEEVTPGRLPTPSADGLRNPDRISGVCNTWFSEPYRNNDAFDHFATFDVCATAGGGTAVGIEDVEGGGDQDFNDLVVAFAPAPAVIYRLARPGIALGASTLGPGAARRMTGLILVPPIGSSALGTVPLTVSVVRNPCADEMVGFTTSVAGLTFAIDWNTPCVFPGDEVIVALGGPPGLQFASGAWEDEFGTKVDQVVPTLLECEENSAPAFTSGPACGSTLVVSPGSKVGFTIAASDADAGDDVALVAAGVPALAAFPVPLPGNPVSASFSWTPTASDLGDHHISFHASDQCLASMPCPVTIRVGTNAAPDCDQAQAENPEVWPPNSLFVPVSIVGITDPEGDPVQIEAVGVTSDEPDGRECDAMIRDGVAFLRAKRLGSGDGRVYYVSYIARDGLGGECSGEVSVCVPHDRAPGHVCVDNGQVPLSLCTTTFSATSPATAADATTDALIQAAMALRVVRTEPAGAHLEFTLPSSGEISLGIYDLAGRRVAGLASGSWTAGVHGAIWNTSGASPGIYFARLRAGTQSATAVVHIVP